MSLDNFHPAVAAWFRGAFAEPTPAQSKAWPAIQSGRHALIAAPTGSGKTLAAFLAAIDALVRRGIEHPLADETSVVYVSPLKALSNDIRINLEAPLAGIREQLMYLGLPDVDIRTAVRTGDTPQSERSAMRRCSPHIVVTTPESLYILLGSESGRSMLASTRTVIVDEIHALAANKRGAHLALSLERLQALCERPLTRIGLSATQKPIDEIAKFLVGARSSPPPHCLDGGEGWVRGQLAGHRTLDETPAPHSASLVDFKPEHSNGPPSPQPSPPSPPSVGEKVQVDCEIVDVGYTRKRDLALELPDAPLSAVMSGEVWEQVYNRLAQLIEQHRTTLIFVNTRRMAERMARHLSERLGKEAVTSHHGSLAREQRLAAEQRLKRGDLRALVATASLELGIDIGNVDLVCQIASPRSISTFLQRAGRAGHSVGGLPKARLFPLSRDDLVECAALLDSVRRGELDTLHVECNPLDVLAQQIVAEVATREWNEDELFALVTRAFPFVDLSRNQFRDIVRMLAEGFTTRRGPRSAYLHRDAVNGLLRARRGARLTAITSGGAIPDTADYEVTLEPQSQRVGTVHEDFAVESLAGDVFQLGNTSYRILRVERGRVRVEDAQGAPPTIPFWLGEAPGRTDELSSAVARLREEIAARVDRTTTPALSPDNVGGEGANVWLCNEVGLGASAAQQIVDYLGAAKSALGFLPTQLILAMERFFDESGGTQLVIHTPYGSRINRAWGLALRKRFCRKFNFELQAAATEDAIILSLSTSHSFPLADVGHYLHSNSVRDVLTQALLDAPMFGVRWRWNATTSLALPRFVGGAKVPPQLQRMKSEDLLATVFPDQVACAENLVGERQVPDHPLVEQTLHDCLHEAMDIEGLESLLKRLESGEIHIVARDLTAPSPLAAEILNARPYAYLDDAPLEERRAQAVQSRRWGDVQTTDDFGRLDVDAIAAVREEAWPQARDADELHEALMGLGFLTTDEIAANSWRAHLDVLIANHRATQVFLPLSQTPVGGEGWGEGDACGSSEPLQQTSDIPLTQPSPPSRAMGERASIWVAIERLPQLQVVFVDIAHDPKIAVPAEFANIEWTPEAALADIVRGRLTGLGPIRAADIAASLELPQGDIDAALLSLEGEGFVMRGHFSPGADHEEWCERHLLARIHRYTVKRLRREIEPVEARDFMRFLFEWQRVAPGSQVSGPDALAGVLAQLEGFEAPAGAWEAEILPARISGYEIGWLDDLCLAGRLVWARLREHSGSGEHGTGPVRATPIVLLQRRNVSMWTKIAGNNADFTSPLSSRARAVADYLCDQGASFFDELASGTHLLHAELEGALAELVAVGRINSDSFAGLRALLVPASKRPLPGRRRSRRTALLGIADAGRWSLLRRPSAPSSPTELAVSPTSHRSIVHNAARAEPDIAEHVVRTLFKRYGVVCWRLLAREPQWLPRWRDLLRVCQRLEARGEIRGGRFIAGVSGEQFALPEAVALLRRIRQKPRDGTLIAVCGADPLNQVGAILAGVKVSALTGSRVLYRDGVPIATLVAGNFNPLEAMDAASQWSAHCLLRRGEATRLAATQT
ncbi:MAG: DEAD/DEAH box helicase [Rudaea sp.]